MYVLEVAVYEPITTMLSTTRSGREYEPLFVFVLSAFNTYVTRYHSTDDIPSHDSCTPIPRIRHRTNPRLIPAASP